MRERPAFHALPVFEHLPFQPARFAPPCAPGPIGFLAGYAPLLLLDMSGTMHPSKGGRFHDMKVTPPLTAAQDISNDAVLLYVLLLTSLPFPALAAAAAADTAADFADIAAVAADIAIAAAAACMLAEPTHPAWPPTTSPVAGGMSGSSVCL